MQKLNQYFSILVIVMGVCFTASIMVDSRLLPSCAITIFKKCSKPLPIETTFKLPAPIPKWPSGEGFASGTIDLGGLLVAQVSTFNKIWATHEGGPDNLGASFYEPTSVPAGFFMLGYYCQPNNQPLFGWVLVGKDITNDLSQAALKMPVDYTLVWSSESQNIEQDGVGYIWLPTPPDGYMAVGHVVTNTTEKPPLDKILCVRSDLTDLIETDTLIWRPKSGLTVYSSRPAARGIQALGVSTGTFIAQKNGDKNPLFCLKNIKNNLSAMPNLSQFQALFEAYSPVLYFHPNERYYPSSVSWFFRKGAVLYTKGKISNPVAIEPGGSNLPPNGSNDGAYWLDLPINKRDSERLKQGKLQNARAYVHIKPMIGATFTDIAVWFFYPFNGPSRAQIWFVDIPLGKIGEHVGDWEHVTLRVSNFNGELKGVYFSQHSKGSWVGASGLEFQNGNKPVAYASLYGHASFPQPGIVVDGIAGIGVRNEMNKGEFAMDTGARYLVVAAEYMEPSAIVEPPWLNYAREWGPRITYHIDYWLNMVARLFPFMLKGELVDIVENLHAERLAEEGPVGPKIKDNWSGDERG